MLSSSITISTVCSCARGYFLGHDASGPVENARLAGRRRPNNDTRIAVGIAGARLGVQFGVPFQDFGVLAVLDPRFAIAVQAARPDENWPRLSLSVEHPDVFPIVAVLA